MWGTNDDLFMARYSAFNPFRIRLRDMGFQTPIGAGDALSKSLYCGMKPTFCWQSTDPNSPTGGIFNLEFSPDGSLLVAACEKRTIQIFDPINHNRIHCMVGAHMDCINCVKFLDSRMFATCSDDTTIALWDIRNLNKKICSLVGHSKWVKNIEFSQKDKLLVTSGLDGSIYTWDINSYTRNNLLYQRVFHTTSLMRCRLSPDSRQMILSTTGGLIILIHNLNLATLDKDLLGFKPNLFRLMQMSQQQIPIASKYDYLFDADRKENRVEFISDFPEGNDAEVVSSLQIHPQGWTALSRNISHDDRSEWTCIHDIQPLDEAPGQKSTLDTDAPRPTGRARLIRPKRPILPYRIVPPPTRLRRSPRFTNRANSSDPPRRSTRLQESQAERRQGDGETPRRERDSARERGSPREREANRRDADGEDGEEEENEEPVAGPSNAAAGDGSNDSPILVPEAAPVVSRGIQNDLWEASISIKQQRILQDLVRRRGSVRRSFNMQRITGINTGITPPTSRSNVPTSRSNVPTSRSNVPTEAQYHFASDRPSLSGMTPGELSVEEWEAIVDNKSKIRQNKDRLLYYIEETNQGKGFIKELCYSADGRIVCSPFGKGIRLLALDENCSEIPSVIQHFKGPTQMHEIGQSLGYHADLVVCAKFNPRFHTLVSGCLEGKIVWYQPYSGEMN